MVAALLRSDRDLRWLLSVALSWIRQGISRESIVGQSSDRLYLAGVFSCGVGSRVCVFTAIANFGRLSVWLLLDSMVGIV